MPRNPSRHLGSQDSAALRGGSSQLPDGDPCRGPVTFTQPREVSSRELGQVVAGWLPRNKVGLSTLALSIPG